MKHYLQLDNPNQKELDALLADGWEFHSEQTQFIVLQQWHFDFGGGSHRINDRVEKHWLVTLVKED